MSMRAIPKPVYDEEQRRKQSIPKENWKDVPIRKKYMPMPDAPKSMPAKKRSFLGKAVSGAIKGAHMVGGMMKPAAGMMGKGAMMMTADPGSKGAAAAGKGMAKAMKNETFSRGPKEMGTMLSKKYKKLMGK